MLLAPLVAALHHAGHTIGMVTREINRDLYRPDLVRAHEAQETRGARALIDEIQARRYDIALIATEKPAGYRLAHDAGIPRRIGFWNGIAKPFKGIWVRSKCTELRYRPASTGTRHEVEMLFELGRGLHGESQPTTDVARLRELFLTTRVPAEQMAVVQITNKWLQLGDVDAVAALLRECHERLSLRFIGSAQEDALLDEFEIATGILVARYRETGAWISRIAATSALITPDTGAAHVAGMLGTRVVDIFSDSSTAAQRRRWLPWASRSAELTMRDVRRGGVAALHDALTSLL